MKFFSGLQLVAVILLGLLLTSLWSCLPENENKTSKKGAIPPAPMVLVDKVTPADIPLQRTFTGHVEGIRSAEVRAQVTGILEKRLYDEGKKVKAGDVLFEIDPSSYQAVVDQAAARVASIRARLARAKRDLDRALPLAERNSISQRDLDAVQTEYESSRAGLAEAEAALRAARINLDLTRVKAPIDGFASMARHNVGSLIQAGSSQSLLTTIHDVDTVQVVFPVSDTQVRRIQGYLADGRAVMNTPISAHLFIDEEHPYPHAGNMVFGNPVISRETGCMIAKASFPNPEKTLLPGQVVRVTLDILTFINALAVPEQAVLQGRDSAMVIVVAPDDTTRFKPIEILARVGRLVLVASGLEGDERIIVEGVRKVGPGMKVNPRMANPADQSGTTGTKV
ncbi:efflux RND transporter periplasmic adaptor subunit [Desulfoplanes formicivorans]|uniref:Hemolysin D n=1 Tax=Desulfoplanes formicivorans TaxID=1592317 RepID=A0A194AHD0_9BACT|nr:efflux RND transporter periplasmic adaptor subunit [Desulfoplanes formicivorans]GAU08620.1 hemolysin D [Desulfoplanes formicivorans]